jgi:hydrogenase maturation protease
MSVLVLGVGNILLKDEGVGIMLVEALEQEFVLPAEVELLDGGTAGIELLDHIRERGLLVIVDAMRNGYPPGTVYRLEGEDVPAAFMTNISPHQLGISNLLATAQLSDCLPERTVLFGIEPEEISTGLGLSASVAGGLKKLISEVVKELADNGYLLERRAGDNSQPPGFWTDKNVFANLEKEAANDV